MSNVLDSASAFLSSAGRVPVDGPPHVHTIILSERERFSNLLAALFRFEEGSFVDATKCGAGVASYDDALDQAPELVAAVQALLAQYNAATPGAELRLDVEPGRVVVRGTADYEAANTAQKALRELATAVLAADLAATAPTV